MIFPTCFVPSVFFDFFLRIARFFLSKRPVFIWTFNITVEYYHWRSYFCYWEYFWITKQNHIWRFNNGDFSVSTKIHSLGLYRVFFWTFKIFDDLLYYGMPKWNVDVFKLNQQCVKCNWPFFCYHHMEFY